MGDAFEIPAIWGLPPPVLFDAATTEPPFQPIDLDLQGIEFQRLYDSLKAHELDLRLSKLDELELGRLDDLSTLDGSVLSSDTDPGSPAPDDLADVWKFEDEVALADEEVNFVNFNHLPPTHAELQSPCVGKDRSDALDSVLERNSEQYQEDNAEKLARSDPLLEGLRLLGLGRASAAFQWDDQNGRFRQAIDGPQDLDGGLHTLQDVIDQSMECGGNTHYLVAFVERIYESNQPLPAMVALANAVQIVLAAVEITINECKARQQDVSHLHGLFTRPKDVLAMLKDVVESVKCATTDEELASTVFTQFRDSQSRDAWLYQICVEILLRISQPWVEMVEEWIGIRPEQGSSFAGSRNIPSFVDVGEDDASDSTADYPANFVLDPSKLPSFIAEEDGAKIFETGRNLRILRTYDPNHPLASPSSNNISAPPLELAFQSEDMDRICEKAVSYEHSLKAAVARYARGEPVQRCPEALGQVSDLRIKTSTDHVSCSAFLVASQKRIGGEQRHDPMEATVLGGSDEDILRVFRTCTIQLDKPPPGPLPPDKLYDIVHAGLMSSNGETANASFPPTLRTGPFSFSPLLGVQARYVNKATLRQMFFQHNLRKHFEMQRAFYLLGSGVFASGLATALFSRDIVTTDRQRGAVRTGSALEAKSGSHASRSLAGFATQLALMDTLTDAYQTDILPHRKHSTFSLKSSDDMPFDLSFSIHGQPKEELDSWHDASSVEATDSLWLQYSAPPPLDTIFTAATLKKYHRIFKHLLRIVRMLKVCDGLFQASIMQERPKGRTRVDGLHHRFRWESQQFVSSIASYIFDVGVGAAWHKFENKLETMEQHLRRDDYMDHDNTDGLSLDRLRSHHEAVLDEIISALFLRARQAKVWELLDMIFESILFFSRTLYSPEADDLGLGREDAGREPDKLYKSFQEHLTSFVSVLRGLNNKRALDQGQTLDPNNDTGSAERVTLLLSMLEKTKPDLAQ